MIYIIQEISRNKYIFYTFLSYFFIQYLIYFVYVLSFFGCFYSSLNLLMLFVGYDLI